MGLFGRHGRGTLNPQQFGQLRLFNGYESAPEEPSGPGTPPDKLLGPPHGTVAGRSYWVVGEPPPYAHPGQGKLFTNADLPSRGH